VKKTIFFLSLIVILIYTNFSTEQQYSEDEWPKITTIEKVI